MRRDDRQHLRSVTVEVERWVEQARSIESTRAAIFKDAQDAVSQLRGAVVDVALEGSACWRVIPLYEGDATKLRAIAIQSATPPLQPDIQRIIDSLSSGISGWLEIARSADGGIRRLFSGGEKRQAADGALRYVADYRNWGVTNRIPALLKSLIEQLHGEVGEISVHDVLGPRVNLGRYITDLGHSSQLVEPGVISELASAVALVKRAVQQEPRLKAAAIDAANAVRRRDTGRLVAEMPVDRLKDVTRNRLRLQPLALLGIQSVREVIDRAHELQSAPGIGDVTARQLVGAARMIWQTTFDEMPTRFDVKNRDAKATALLRALQSWESARTVAASKVDVQRANGFSVLTTAVGNRVAHAVVLSNSEVALDEFSNAVDAVISVGRKLSGRTPDNTLLDPWDEFLRRPADFFALLSELGVVTEDPEKVHGDLSAEIIAAVREFELDTRFLSASLRGYQHFAARFALVQRKVIIGDEMGLGKTVEALAVLAHVRAQGTHHSLVICPAAVVTNWIREIGTKSHLNPHRLHGPERLEAHRSWVRRGGVAVTTFETLGWLHVAARLPELGCVIVDEAHYIKNPYAQRTQRTIWVLDQCKRAVLLTGTPLENRIDEFRNLVGYLRPDLVVTAGGLSPLKFRKQVAPAYLRRNQEDVLAELPELVEVEDWLPMSGDDKRAYFLAVTEGNFNSMRQAVLVHKGQSSKLSRLVEVVEEAEDNGRRVIVFSHYRKVLDEVSRALPGQVFGPLHGAIPAVTRQRMVDEFSAAGHGAVLVAQIVAGGVGLNIQAASVVVICEPQLKPTTEWQAIARAHRMGQLESVQVHRLLSEDCVDERITEILARKRAVFNDFAKLSETAASAPEAYDVSEAQIAREIVAAERERLLSQEERFTT